MRMLCLIFQSILTAEYEELLSFTLRDERDGEEMTVLDQCLENQDEDVMHTIVEYISENSKVMNRLSYIVNEWK